jgi:hypothetical protein
LEQASHTLAKAHWTGPTIDPEVQNVETVVHLLK